MTTEAVIQRMHARTLANANGQWWETYDRLSFQVCPQAVAEEPDAQDEEHLAWVPLVPWRVRDVEQRWFALGGALAIDLEVASGEDCRWLARLAEGMDRGVRWTLDGELRADLPESVHSNWSDLERRYPAGFVVCSPRIWNEAGFEAAPVAFDVSWRPAAHYAYFYFSGLEAAREGRAMLQRFGLATYMPIDRFGGLLALVHVATGVALALMFTVLATGTLGIVVTLFTEVDAGAAEIGLHKALGASNRLVGVIFLMKGALVGALGSFFGIPAGMLFGQVINRYLVNSIAEQAGLDDAGFSLFRYDPQVLCVLAAGIIMLAALAALAPALMAARKDPQESLRED
jgi:hypothetical protein